MLAISLKPSTFAELIESTSAGPGDLVVMDKGIATKDNLEYLRDRNFRYVVASWGTRSKFDP
jgi:hypothetical protein